jgi:hypothetical protein
MVELQVKLLEYVMKIWRQEEEERFGLFSTFYDQYANLLARGEDICRIEARRETIKIWFFFFLLWSLPASYLSLFISLIFWFLSHSLLGQLGILKLRSCTNSSASFKLKMILKLKREFWEETSTNSILGQYNKNLQQHN